jgi:hypothetical protein
MSGQGWINGMRRHGLAPAELKALIPEFVVNDPAAERRRQVQRAAEALIGGVKAAEKAGRERLAAAGPQLAAVQPKLPAIRLPALALPTGWLCKVATATPATASPPAAATHWQRRIIAAARRLVRLWRQWLRRVWTKRPAPPLQPMPRLPTPSLPTPRLPARPALASSTMFGIVGVSVAGVLGFAYWQEAQVSVISPAEAPHLAAVVERPAAPARPDEPATTARTPAAPVVPVSAPAAPPPLPTLASPALDAGWQAMQRPVELFTLESPELQRLTYGYAARRHASGLREDALTWRLPSGATMAHVAITRGTDYAILAPLTVELARRAAGHGLSIARSATPGPLATKFGSFEVVDVQLANDEGGQRPCLGFRFHDAEARIAMAGWLCTPDQRTVERPQFACVMDRLGLLRAGDDKPLRIMFTEAERRRVLCPSQRNAGPGRRISWTESEAPPPRLRGEKAASAR